MLLLATVAERFTFKLMVDRMESYRYFIAQLLSFVYIPPMFIIVAYKATLTEQFDEQMTEFPKHRFVVMAALDLCHSLLLILAGGKTPAPLTVLLFQGTIPMTVLFSALFFANK